MLTASLVAGECIKRRVEGHHHRDSVEIGRLVCLDSEGMRKASGDLHSVCIRKALVEETEHRERVDVRRHVRTVKFRELHVDLDVGLPQLGNKRLPIITVRKQLIRQLCVIAYPCELHVHGFVTFLLPWPPTTCC